MKATHKIIRVFPRRTNATPTDNMAFVGRPPIILPKGDEVHVSCTFTWDKPYAKLLVDQWQHYYKNVKIGGPAYDSYAGEFEPGMYLKPGYTITTRGCPNKCSFCFVPKREGALRCLKIKEGYNVLDNNLLAAPKEHIKTVLEMLSRQKEPALFTGGLEARRIDKWFINELKNIRVERLFLAYDRASEKEPVIHAAKLLHSIGFNRSKLSCYVLCAYKNDTIEKALERMRFIKSLEVTPFAMFFRENDAKPTIDIHWRKFRKKWIRPTAIWAKKQIDAY